MAQTTRTDPYIGSYFRLEISGIQVAGFSEASIPKMEIEEVDYREGTDKMRRKLSGLPSVSSVVLKKGLTSSTELYDWYTTTAAVGATLASRKSISIILVDPAGDEKVRWNCVNAWPSSLETGGLDAKSSDVVIETLEIQVESMTRSQ